MSTMNKALLVLAKLALADGKIEPNEREFLEEYVGQSAAFETVDGLLEVAKGQSLEDMLSELDCSYEDKFFIALRAYLMAHVDHHYDVKEEALFNKLVDSLGILKSDRALIHEAELLVKAQEPRDPPLRIQELYRKSSFSKEERNF